MLKHTTSNIKSFKSIHYCVQAGVLMVLLLSYSFLANSMDLSKSLNKNLAIRSYPGNQQTESFAEAETDPPGAVKSNPDTTQRMNVLFVAIDDLNDWVGCMGGNPQVRTPHLDDFHSQGAMVMYNAHAPATVCCPSRSALLTGVHAHKTGVYGNRNNLKYAPKAKDLVTLPEYFSMHGYLSLTMGKIFHKHNYDDRENDHGQWAFDEYYNTLPGMGPLSNDRPVNGLPNLENEPPSYHYTAFDWGPTVHNDEKQMLDYKTAKWAAEQLTGRDFEKPFFMAVGFSKPHLSWYIPQKYFDMYPLEDIVIPENRMDDLDDILDSNGNTAYSPNFAWLRAEMYDRHKEATRAYLAATTFIDDCVGVLLDGLANSKYAENTIVMIWGDHGWYLGEKLRYGKTQLWQEACRVPFMVKVPGVTPENKTCYGVVNLIDMYPTLVDLCNLPENPVNDGRSFSELLHHPDMVWNEPTLTTNDYKMHRIYDGRYSYIMDERKGAEQLYDHSVDSMEWTNLINDPVYNEIKAHLKSFLPLSDEPESPRNEDLPPPIPVDTARKVWIFPGDSVFAWQYDFFDHLSLKKQFSDDSSHTIGLYGCNDRSGVNIRNYVDAEQSDHSAQFNWDTTAQTFVRNGQWVDYSVHFASNEPYQLFIRARKQVDANFKLTITSKLNGDTVFHKDCSLWNDFMQSGEGNEKTDWLFSLFPLTNIWGRYRLRFDWYDNIGEPGVFGGFTFLPSNLDITPPEWYFVTIGELNIDEDNLTVMTNEACRIYLVPAGTSVHIDSIRNAAVAIIDTEAFEEAEIDISGVGEGEYVVIAIDSSNNISVPSQLITLMRTVAFSKLRHRPDIHVLFHYSERNITIKSATHLQLIELYDISGRKVKEMNPRGNDYTLHTNELLPGFFTLRILDEHGDFETAKIVIQ